METKQSIAIDLHCHSTHSDGSLNVREVLQLVKAQGGLFQALTDHDTIDGIAEAKQIAEELHLNLIPGVEISVSWHNNSLIHILGLNIDEKNPLLIEELTKLRSSRLERGQRIATNLAKIGIADALAGALALCNNPQALSRTHFAQFLVNNGYARAGQAFEKFLAPGKPGYTPQTWASLADAVTWITQSGGVAVIAHPGRYKFTRTRLLKLIEEFKAYGGSGMEVISSSHSLSDEANMAAICRHSQLLASVGSDFHQQTSYRIIKPGRNKPLPSGVMPIFPHLGIDAHHYLN